MALNIAFIGYDERQTRIYFEELAVVNADQVARFDRRRGQILLRDGTQITLVSSAPDFLPGRRFDQVIVADDRRRLVFIKRWPEFAELERCMDQSPVPEEFRLLLYDLDAEGNEYGTAQIQS